MVGEALWKAGEKYEIGPFWSDHMVAKEEGLYLGVVAFPWAHPPTTQQCHPFLPSLNQIKLLELEKGEEKVVRKKHADIIGIWISKDLCFL